MENMEEKILLNDEELEAVDGGANPPSKDPGKGLKWYQIQAGDNLTRIAARFGTNIDNLIEINRDRRGIKDKNHIYAGYWIRVPK